VGVSRRPRRTSRASSSAVRRRASELLTADDVTESFSAARTTLCSSRTVWSTRRRFRSIDERFTSVMNRITNHHLSWICGTCQGPVMRNELCPMTSSHAADWGCRESLGRRRPTPKGWGAGADEARRILKRIPWVEQQHRRVAKGMDGRTPTRSSPPSPRPCRPEGGRGQPCDGIRERPTPRRSLPAPRRRDAQAVPDEPVSTASESRRINGAAGPGNDGVTSPGDPAPLGGESP